MATWSLNWSEVSPPAVGGGEELKTIYSVQAWKSLGRDVCTDCRFKHQRGSDTHLHHQGLTGFLTLFQRPWLEVKEGLDKK